MHYLLLIYDEQANRPDLATEAELNAMLKPWYAYSQALEEAGVMVGGNALQKVETAATVRVRDGETITADGPFAETKEQLGGYYLIDVVDQAEALMWAAKCPGAQFGSVEVRPIQEY